MSFKLVKEGLREPVRLLICGDREWDDFNVVFNRLRKLKKKCGLTLTVIHGQCMGADSIADQAAHILGIDRI